MDNYLNFGQQQTPKINYAAANLENQYLANIAPTATQYMSGFNNALNAGAAPSLTDVGGLDGILSNQGNYGSNLFSSGNAFGYTDTGTGAGGMMPTNVTPVGAGAPASGGFMSQLQGMPSDVFGEGVGWGDVGQGVMGGIGAINNIAQAWSAFKALDLAKDSFKFQKRAFNKQLGDNRQTYNTSLENRANNKASTYEWSDKEREDYINRNRLGG
jgi:hypothetical protein